MYFFVSGLVKMVGPHSLQLLGHGAGSQNSHSARVFWVLDREPGKRQRGVGIHYQCAYLRIALGGDLGGVNVALEIGCPR